MIDSHHHIWRQQDLPWLLGPEQPRIFGRYKGIKRDYLMDEYIRDVSSAGIEKSVYVQANWSPNWAADEVAWVQSVAEDYAWPHAIVAFADFTGTHTHSQLEKLAEYDLLRGVRQQLHWHENPQYRFAPSASIASDPFFQSNIRLLADYDWCFDLQVFAGQMQHAVSLVKSCPDVNFILQHAGMLENTSPEGLQQWRHMMATLSEFENVAVKLSGLGTFVHGVDIDLIDQIVAETLEHFGATRCMFGSNFPIEKLWTSYEELWVAMKTVTAQCSESEQQAIFNDTAQRLYRPEPTKEQPTKQQQRINRSN